jgi:nicotinamidase-related amidase
VADSSFLPFPDQPAGDQIAMASRDYLADYAPSFRLRPEDTALLIVDMQYASGCRTAGLGRLLREQGREQDGLYRFDRIEHVVVPNISRLLSTFRDNGMHVVYLTVGSERPDFQDMPMHMRRFAQAVGNTRGRREHDILDELCPLAQESVLNKTTAGAFNSTGLDTLLHTLGARQLVVTGISTNSCVESTARDGADRAYDVVLVDDACGAARRELHDATLVSFRRLFGRVVSTDEVIHELAEPIHE